MKDLLIVAALCILLWGCGDQYETNKAENAPWSEADFLIPPDSAGVWVLWDWINCNISKEGITRDLESMKDVGINGVVWRGLAGPWWAPRGPVSPYTAEWHEHMQWAIREAERLGVQFDISIDFGYGSGGPHITPDQSMQKLYWTRVVVDGGKPISMTLEKPEVSKKGVEQAWLRQGEKLRDKVLDDIGQIDSYRDIAVMAIPHSPGLETYIIPQFDLRTGLGSNTYFLAKEELEPPDDAVVSTESIVDVTNHMNPDGQFNWDAPPGQWQIVRLGHASNFKMTRPCPPDAVGLECDRLSPGGITAHYEAFLEPIIEAAGAKAGKTLTHIFLDSWEAGAQNWTAGFPQEFRDRRGYDIHPWLPVLTGIVEDNSGLTERFLWDFRQTVSEVTIDNYRHTLGDLISPFDIKFSYEAYGNLCINTLEYAEVSDFPIGEFWTLGKDYIPVFGKQGYYNTLKTMASAAHTTGKSWVGAEAFTASRGWKDHPFVLKGMGDKAFCLGINKFILHLSAHQAYENMIPGLTHRKWGGHFNRYNTWWGYSKPWFDYLNRCQYMLQQGQFVADICYLFGEGSPLAVEDMDLDLPTGYDYDLCSSDIVQQMEVHDGNLVLPSGMCYRYLLLPNTDRLTLSTALKIKELAASGARIVGQKRVIGTPGLSDYPEADQQVQRIADDLWDQNKIITEPSWDKIFSDHALQPDFAGEGLNYIHRKTDGMDVYFVANPDPEVVEVDCSFRVLNKTPELWDPETGEIRELPVFSSSDGRVSVPLRFGPMQSWFIVFRTSGDAKALKSKNFPEYVPVSTITGAWKVGFDPNWGGPEGLVVFDTLSDWSLHADQGIRHYSGTAVYNGTFRMPATQLSPAAPVFLDLGKVEVMARVRVNGKDCGIAWKPPYRVDISDAWVSGENQLEIEVVNTWVNRMIGDEHLPEDCHWLDWERLSAWPDWFLNNEPRPSGRYTFTTAKHYTAADPLLPSGLLGPVRILKQVDLND